MSKTGEQTVRVLDEAYKTIRSGAPGLSDQTCNVLAGIIARKVSIVYAQPQPSQQAGVEGEALSKNACQFDAEIAWLREAARYFAARDTKGEDSAHWANVYNAENASKLADRLAALKPVEG